MTQLHTDIVIVLCAYVFTGVALAWRSCAWAAIEAVLSLLQIAFGVLLWPFCVWRVSAGRPVARRRKGGANV